MNFLTVHYEPGLTISLELPGKRWLAVNNRKWGFLRDSRTLYCHRNRVEVFNKEFGFHIPKHLLNYTIVFEVKLKDVYSTWTYDPKHKQRMLATTPLIFVSLARLLWRGKAEHVPRPR